MIRALATLNGLAREGPQPSPFRSRRDSPPGSDDSRKRLGTEASTIGTVR